MRRFFIICAVLPLFLACDKPPAGAGQPPALRQLAAPDTSGLDEAMSDALLKAWQNFQGDSSGLQGDELASAYGQLGMLYQANHALSSARGCYENAILLAPQQAKWRYYFAYLLEESGETSAALEAYREVTRLEPGDLPARLRAARLLLALGDFDGAASGFAGVLNEEPGNAVAIAGMGQIALASGDYQEAVRQLSRALALQPAATRLYQPLGLALRGLGRSDAAAEAFARRGASDVVFADPRLAELSALSRSAQAYLTRATAAAQDGRYEAAARAYAQGVELDPDNHLARAGLAQALERLGRFDEALEEVGKVLEINPDYALARLQKGRLLERLGDDKNAVLEYQHALASDPEYTEARFLLANALMRLGHAEAAIPEYEKAAQRLPESVLVLYRLGVAELAAQRCDDATRTLRKASDRNPSYGPVVEALVRNAATCPAIDNRLRVQALEDGRWLYKQLPNARHAETLAMALAANGIWERAIELQQEAIRLTDEDSDPVAWQFMQANLGRYQRHEVADKAWPADAGVFVPPPAGAS